MDSIDQHAPASDAGLLEPGEPGACTVLDRVAAAPALLVCDHAAARIPAALGTLGLPPEALADHIALDIGAAAVTRHLSEALNLPAVLTEYSRLVVDCNRRLDDPTAFPAVVDGYQVPGNQNLSGKARRVRAEELYWPYHHCVRDELARLEAMATAPALIAIHSFTPVFGETMRPWQIGILWDKDPRLPEQLIPALRSQDGVLVGDNEPYSGKHPADFTVDHHAESEGLAHVGIEIRQDLITTLEGAEHWGGLLADALRPILDDPELYSHWPGTR
ncbi:MAG: N-formylglutamate amidohydrolase [Gammaproteobacteria bacterium]|nr:N-formylglutamate amidohydrolase [Gammaproteobacteria bacterium]